MAYEELRQRALSLRGTDPQGQHDTYLVGIVDLCGRIIIGNIDESDIFWCQKSEVSELVIWLPSYDLNHISRSPSQI